MTYRVCGSELRVSQFAHVCVRGRLSCALLSAEVLLFLLLRGELVMQGWLEFWTEVRQSSTNAGRS